MALIKLIKDGYGQVELNNVAFRRDGRIEAQCKLDEEDFATIPAENGMLLMVDNVTRTVKLPEDETGKGLIALNYSAEHLQDEKKEGLKNFKLERGTFLPRLGYLVNGDKFTTNAVIFEEGEDETVAAHLSAISAALKQGEKVTANPSTQGYIKVLSTHGLSGYLQVIEVTTMPDGQPALKFQVIGA